MVSNPTRQASGGRREIALTVAMLLVTIAATVFLGRDLLAAATATDREPIPMARLVVFATVIGALIFGNVVYQVSRLGALVRERRYRATATSDLVDDHWERAEAVTTLVPSYREDERTIRQTLLSAALQHYPRSRVVLLLDDPPAPVDSEQARALASARRVPEEIAELLAEPIALVDASRRAMTERLRAGEPQPRTELKALLALYGELVAWFARRAESTPVTDQTDAHFIEVTYRAHARLLEERGRSFAEALASDQPPSVDGIAREHDRLRSVFETEITVFQRKRYRNLSHEPSKAGNLNAYIGLMGTRVREARRRDGIHLEPSDDGSLIPDTPLLLTLDADSMLAPDYTLRLAAELAAPGNERVGVAQTPYTAVPNAPGVLERIAGATTDIQYIVHQGFTWCGATFWVGANALLRKAALEAIRTDAVVDGRPVARYIQDRTVIEDTESTIDLATRGWDLLNVPVRMAWSATPPDFGALLIQRTRWANGGLLIVPKLARQLVRARFAPRAIGSFLVRLHYLTSIASGSIGLVILLFLPLGGELESAWLPLTALPYFLLYWRDLLRSGYRRADILRVYAFNLMLIPINVAGVAKSLQQAVTGERVPFGRTPKVPGRTAAPRWAVLALWGLVAWCLMAATFDGISGRWAHAGFALLTATGLGYAGVVFVGVRESVEDALRGWSLPWLDTPAEAASRIGDRPAR